MAASKRCPERHWPVTEAVMEAVMEVVSSVETEEVRRAAKAVGGEADTRQPPPALERKVAVEEARVASARQLVAGHRPWR